MATRRRTSTPRRRTRRRRQQTPLVVSRRFVREGLALVLVFLAILSVIALFAPTAGAIVEPWHDVLSTSLGWGIAFAAPLLAGFALMLWMKTMPAERWMAATGAAIFALAILGMFHLFGGQDAGADVLKQIQGTWKFVSQEMEGKPRPREELAKQTITFAGDKWTVRRDGKVVQAGTHKFDPGKKPAQVDAVVT